MKELKQKIFISLSIVAVAVAPIIFTFQNTSASPFCVSEKCKAAEAAEREARQKAADAINSAKTLEGEIEHLNAEITVFEARIKSLQAEAQDLAKQILENEAKLQDQKTVLANMLIDLYFTGEPDAIMILASSSSISDYAEKQSRLNAAKEQITVSAQAIKKLKEELESQKAEVDRNLADQKLQQDNIIAKRNEQNALVAKYKYNAEAFTADAEAALQAMREEISKYQRVGVVGNGTNTYDLQGDCPHGDLSYVDSRLYYVCQCTSYAAYKVAEYYHRDIVGWGDAASWGWVARSLGYHVSNTPAAGTVGTSTAGTYGHVVWVESVNSDGSVNISEYNNPWSSASGLWGDFGVRYNVPAYNFEYIYF